MKQVQGRKLLIIDDDQELTREFQTYFEAGGNAVCVAGSIEQGVQHLHNELFDAVILDLLLPDGEGTALLARQKNLPPVIILSVLSDEENMLEGFSLGAQDYVVKPCSPRLLEMRLALRLLPKPMSVLELHGLRIHSGERTLAYQGQPIRLTGSEFNILWFLMSNAGHFFTANQIFEKVWGENSLEQTSIKFHISNLRRKLIEHTGQQLILTKFGNGYTFAMEGEL